MVNASLLTGWFLRFQNLSLFYAARLVPGACNFILVLALTHQVPPDQYGKFSIWLATVMGCAFFLYGWLAQAIARHANGSDDELSKRPGTFIVGFGIAFAVAVVCAAVAAILRALDQIDAALIALGATLWGAHTVLVGIAQARFALNRYVWTEAARALITLTCVITFAVVVAPTYRSAEFGFVIGQALALVVALVMLPQGHFAKARKLVIGEWNWLDIGRVREMLVYGAPISAWLGLMTIWPAVDRRAIAWVSNANEVGLYATEYDVVFRSFVFVLLPITLYLQPMIFRAHAEEGFFAVERLIRRGLKSQMLIGLGFSVFYFMTVAIVLPRFGVFGNLRPMNIALLCAAAVVWQSALLCHKWLECAKQVGLMFGALAASLLVIALPIGLSLFSFLGAGAFALGFLVGGMAYSGFCYWHGSKAMRRLSCSAQDHVVSLRTTST